MKAQGKCGGRPLQPNSIDVPEWEACRPTQREGAPNEAYDYEEAIAEILV